MSPILPKGVFNHLEWRKGNIQVFQQQKYWWDQHYRETRSGSQRVQWLRRPGHFPAPEYITGIDILSSCVPYWFLCLWNKSYCSEEGQMKPLKWNFSLLPR